MPIITFVNKLDREGRDPFDLLDEIEQALVLDVTPAAWPIGMGAIFSPPTTSSPTRCIVRARPPRNCRGYCRKPRSRRVQAEIDRQQCGRIAFD